ncbi:short-chain dehydrogenase, partial [Microbacterium testaceum]|uniref:SDR family NAD(P)-dependent oxidoreductase n=1 Tax=Microbacterium testaceum TaxID=2033 RepID=UPI000792657C
MSAGEFDGLSVVVTGGASGIGLATAQAFAARGARVSVLDLVTDHLDEGLTGFGADVTDRDSVDAALAAVADRFGGVDVLVNSAGVSCVGTVEEATEADWDRVLNINVRGTARACAAALPYLKRSERASIVNVCSIGALNGLPQRAVYNASKGAILSLTYAMAT